MPVTTLQNLLAQKGPARFGIEPTPSRPRPALNWITVKRVHMAVWNDFNHDSISQAYADILQSSVPQIPDLPASFDLNNLSGIKDMEGNYLCRLISPCLEQARQVLGSRLELGECELKPRRDDPILQSPGALRPANTFVQGSTRLVMSAVRKTIDWSSGGDLEATGLFSQLAGYSNQAGSRYTYALTQDELVVARFFFSDGPDGRDVLSIQYRAISLDAYGPGILTPGLALLALVLMSLNDAHRNVVHHTATYPLNGWLKQQLSDGTERFIRHLSRREVLTLPVGAVIVNAQEPEHL